MTMKVSVRKISYAAVLIGVAVPFAMPGLGHDKGMVALVKQVVTDPLSLLAARSPGMRDGARLVSAKGQHNSAVVRLPEEFVAPQAAVPAFSNASPQNMGDGPLPAFPAAADEIAPTSGKAPVLPPQDGFGSGPLGGGWSAPILPIGIGVLGGGGPARGGGTDPGQPVAGGGTGSLPGIPEPSSWSMLVIGFLMAGAAIRARAV